MRIVGLITLFLVLIGPAQAADRQAVTDAVANFFPGQPVTPVIGDSPLPGISEVAFGTQVLYVSEDGQYALAGPLIALADGTNLTEQRVAGARQTILDTTADLRKYRYPADEPRHRITVITDIDCPYCRRLHNNLAEYQQLGIDISYLMMPRSGKASASYRNTVSAACAADPEAAITAAMNGQIAEPATCAHPIDEHMALARSLGANSTPSILLPNGRMILGLRKPAELLKLIESGEQ